LSEYICYTSTIICMIITFSN